MKIVEKSQMGEIARLKTWPNYMGHALPLTARRLIPSLRFACAMCAREVSRQFDSSSEAVSFKSLIQIIWDCHKRDNSCAEGLDEGSILSSLRIF